MENWINIARTIEGHWLGQYPRRLVWWLDLLVLAECKDRKVCVGNTLYVIKRGQLVTSISSLQDRWEYHRVDPVTDRPGKDTFRPSTKTVLDFLNLLEQDGMITRRSLTAKHSKHGTVITICNYDSLQAEREDASCGERKIERNCADYQAETDPLKNTCGNTCENTCGNGCGNTCENGCWGNEGSERDKSIFRGCENDCECADYQAETDPLGNTCGNGCGNGCRVKERDKEKDEKEKVIQKEKEEKEKEREEKEIFERKSKIEEKSRAEREPQPVFRKPSIEEVKSYAGEKGYAVDAEKFWSFYESKGWMVGRNKMKSWQAAMAVWQKTENERQHGNSGQKDEDRRRGYEVSAATAQDYTKTF